MTNELADGERVDDAERSPGTLHDSGQPGFGWSLASASLVVGSCSLLFSIAPFWCLFWLAAITAGLRYTPIGTKVAHRERDALLGGLSRQGVITRWPLATVIVAFLLPIALLAGLSWDISDPSDQWNGGILLVVAVIGFLTWLVVLELRASGHRARWWGAWLVLTCAVGGFMLVGGPARVRWAHCVDRLTTVAAAGNEVTTSNTGSYCWHDADQVVVDGQVRLYIDLGDGSGEGAGGLVYSPDNAVESAGDIRSLIDLGDGWFWFETGSLVRDFWFDK